MPDKYDPTVSKTATYIPGTGGTHEDAINLDAASKTLQNVTLTGNEIEDDIGITFKNEITYNFRSIFLGVDGSTNAKFYSVSDGFLGLAPYTANPDAKERNFLW